MKILVMGSTGMAGHVITRYLTQQGYTVKTAARNHADYILDVEAIKESDTFFSVMREFDFVINCIGLLVKDSNDRPDRAITINSWWPQYCAYTLKDTDTKLIHLSTDCVFDGQSGPYVEDAIHTEKNSYGRSKSFGEIANTKDITFRMSIIGPELKNGTGLLHWCVTNTDYEIPGWDNAWWNGITTLELAKCIEKYINNPIIVGVYHLVNNNNKINKFDLLSKINNIYNLDKKIVKTQGPKPVNKILIDTRNLINFDISEYDNMLLEMKNFKDV